MTNKLDYIDEAYLELVMLNADAPIRICEMCNHEGKDVINVYSRTLYCWDGEGEDPNRDLVLCLECARSYDDDMTEKWREYYSSVM